MPKCIRIFIGLVLLAFLALISEPVHRHVIAAQATCAQPVFRAGNTYNEVGQFVATADFNGDGKQDFVVANDPTTALTIYFGDGLGGFNKGPISATPSGFDVKELRVGDSNGDRIPDVYAFGINRNSASSDQIQVWENRGNGTFNALPTASRVINLPELYHFNLPQLLLTDLNRDGRTDMIIHQRQGQFLYRLVMVTATDLNLSGALISPAHSTLLVGDINFDGNPDLITAQNNPGKLWLQRGNGNGTFQTPTEIFSPQSNIVSAALIDFNRTGSRDFVLALGAPNQWASATDSYSLLVVSPNGNGQYEVRLPVENAFRTSQLIWQIADLTGDGKPEVLLREPEVPFTAGLATNNGRGGICPPTYYSAFDRGPNLADFNNDGKLDLLIAENGQVKVMLNQTAVAAAPPAIMPVAAELKLAHGTSQSLPIATVSDAQLPANRLQVEIVSAYPGLSVMAQAPAADGKVIATISANCPLALGTARFTLRVTNEANQSATAVIAIQVSIGPGWRFRNAPTQINLREGLPYLLAVLPPRSTPITGTDFVVQYDYVDMSTEAPNPYVVFNGREATSRQMVGANEGNYYTLTGTSHNTTLTISLHPNCPFRPPVYQAIAVTAQAANVANSLAVTSAASYSASWLNREQIVAAFGTKLATTTVSATTLDLPTTLAGTQVRIHASDGLNYLAPLFFVSPNQINFLIPANTPLGRAQILVSNNNEVVATGSTNINFLAPGFFTANASGTGLAAALVLRVLPNGVQRYEPVARFDTATNQFVAVPIDLSNPNEQAFLVLYGTGFRGRGLTCTPLNVTIGGRYAERLYSGPQGSLAGLDQINLRLPRELIGRGEVDVVATHFCYDANIVRVNIK